MTTRHIVIDETKEHGYIVAASSHLATDVDALRKTLRGEFVLPGQTRIHMAKERDQRRRKLVDAICQAGTAVTVYDAGNRYRDPLDARAACLQAVIAGIPANKPTHLVLEQKDSILQWDRRFLYKAVRDAGLAMSVTYVHHRAKTELLLCVPDAIAWCWARGGGWRNRIEPAISEVRTVCRVPQRARNPARPPSGRLPGSLPEASAPGSPNDSSSIMSAHSPDLRTS